MGSQWRRLRRTLPVRVSGPSDVAGSVGSSASNQRSCASGVGSGACKSSSNDTGSYQRSASGVASGIGSSNWSTGSVGSGACKSSSNNAGSDQRSASGVASCIGSSNWSASGVGSGTSETSDSTKSTGGGVGCASILGSRRGVGGSSTSNVLSTWNDLNLAACKLSFGIVDNLAEL
jgi:hypothetical protein